MGETRCLDEGASAASVDPVAAALGEDDNALPSTAEPGDTAGEGRMVDGDDEDDDKDASDPEPDAPEPKEEDDHPPQHPELTPDERTRRLAILFRPWVRSLMEAIARPRFKGDDDLIDSVCNAAFDQAITDPAFPSGASEKTELRLFIRRATWRVLKQRQRHLAREREVLVRPKDGKLPDGPVHVAPHSSEEAAKAHEARLHALDEYRDTPGYKLFWKNIVERKSHRAIADEEQIPERVVRRKIEKFVAKTAVALTAVAVAIVLFINRPCVPGQTDLVAHGYNRALEDTERARQECNAGAWKECSEWLDAAADADPTIKQAALFQELRSAADKALAPRPAPTDSAVPDDRKAPGPPDKGGTPPDKPAPQNKAPSP